MPNILKFAEHSRRYTCLDCQHCNRSHASVCVPLLGFYLVLGFSWAEVSLHALVYDLQIYPYLPTIQSEFVASSEDIRADNCSRKDNDAGVK
jgi:hypothetical protein